MKLKLTGFPPKTRGMAKGVSVATDWDSFAESLRSQVAGPCSIAVPEDDPNHCAGRGTKGKAGCPHKASGNSWSPATFAQNYRNLANVEEVAVLALDWDDGLTDEILNSTSLPPFRSIYHSTHSSRPGFPSLRAVFALSRPVTSREWPLFWEAAKRALGLPCIGGASKDASRLYYRPSHPLGAQPLYLRLEGPPLDVDAIMATVPSRVALPAPEEDLGSTEHGLDPEAEERWPPMEVRVRLAKERLKAMDPGEGGFNGSVPTMKACAMVVRSYGVTDLAAALEALDEWNQRCTPPWDPSPDARTDDSLIRKVREAAKGGRGGKDVPWGAGLAALEFAQSIKDLARRPPTSNGSNGSNGSKLTDVSFDEADRVATARASRPASDDDEEGERARGIEVDEKGRPWIYVQKGRAWRAVEQADEIIFSTNYFFTRGSDLVILDQPRVTPQPIVQTERDEEGVMAVGALETISREPDAPTIEPISADRTWVELGRNCKWNVWNNQTKSYEEDDPPKAISNAVYNFGRRSNARHLDGIITCPAFRSDGSLITAPGWDSATGLYLAPTGVIPKIDTRASRDRAHHAAGELLDAVSDFPFATPADRAAWLAALLGPLLIPAAGCPPLIMVTSPAAGSGKSLLVHTIGLIVAGRRMACGAYVDSDTEMEKRIVAHAIKGDMLILVDNVPNGAQVGWPSLDGALTAGAISGRLLGKSTMLAMKTRWAWFATGNNCYPAGDTARRTLEIRIVFPGDRPHARRVETFKHHPLLPWVAHERPRLLKAALELVCAYFHAGAPASGLEPLGSFESWSRIVRDAVLWVGEEDAQKKLSVDLDSGGDPQRQALAAFYAALFDAGAKSPETAKTSNDIKNICLRPGTGADLKQALLDLLDPDRNDAVPSATMITKGIRQFRERRISVRGKVLFLKDRLMRTNQQGFWVEEDPTGTLN